jgi:hypothetical protein
MTTMVPDPLYRFLVGAHPWVRAKRTDTRVRPCNLSFFNGNPIFNPASGCGHPRAASVKGAVHTPLDRPLWRLGL